MTRQAQPVEGSWDWEQGSHQFPQRTLPSTHHGQIDSHAGGWDTLVDNKIGWRGKGNHITLSEKAHRLSASVIVRMQWNEIVLNSFLFTVLPYLNKNLFIHSVSLNRPSPRKSQFRLTFWFKSTEGIYLWYSRTRKPEEKATKIRTEKNHAAYSHFWKAQYI